jgi:hypothetical protein
MFVTYLPQHYKAFLCPVFFSSLKCLGLDHDSDQVPKQSVFKEGIYSLSDIYIYIYIYIYMSDAIKNCSSLPYLYLLCVVCVLYCFCNFVCCVLFECGVFFV